MLTTYDPKGYDVIWAGILIDCFSSLNITTEGPKFTDEVDLCGNVVRTRNHDRRATVTIEVLQTSEINDVFSQACLDDLDAVNGSGVGSLRIVDRNGSTVFEASQAWISNDPDIELGAEASTRTWEIRAADFRAFHGSVPNGL